MPIHWQGYGLSENNWRKSHSNVLDWVDSVQLMCCIRKDDYDLFKNFKTSFISSTDLKVKIDIHQE